MAGDETADRLRALFALAVARAQPRVTDFPISADLLKAGRVGVVALGKAAAGMMQAWLAAFALAGGRAGALSGVCVAPHGTDLSGYCWPAGIVRMTARHPVPDEASVAAARAALELAAGLGTGDVLVALISGGGSALMTLPVAGETLDSLQAQTAQLLASGAPIGEINARRRALCTIKGGGLGRAALPARVESFVLSDIPGDRLEDVASGPTAGCGALHMTGSAGASLAAAAAQGTAWGWRVVSLGDGVEGEARAVARDHAGLAARFARKGATLLILSGGETGVSVRGTGRGGRNSEYALALALELERARCAAFGLAADTDGIDGRGPQAGAWFDPDTLVRARAAGLDPEGALADNDSGTFFDRLGQTVMTGQTGTNVNDFRAILVPPEAVEG